MTASDSELSEEISRVARAAYQRGLQTGNGGNLSARLHDGGRMLIKSSGTSFADCAPELLVEVEIASGRVLSGSASSELPSHLEIYRRRPDVGGIFHCHAPWSIASAEALDSIPAITRHSLQKAGPIPILRTASGPSSDGVVPAMRRLLDEQPAMQAFVEARHGIFAFGPTVTAASYTADLVEETAQIALLVSLVRRGGGA